MYGNLVLPAVQLLVSVLLLPVGGLIIVVHRRLSAALTSIMTGFILSLEVPLPTLQQTITDSMQPLQLCDDRNTDPESDVQQDSEEDYEEDEDAGADDDGEYGDGDGDPCPNCGRKYRCTCIARAFVSSMLHNLS